MATLEDDLKSSGYELRETHISWVFLGAEDVYKVKKPVDLGFLSFTTPERRRHACQAEVELNRRLTRDVYHGVVPVTREADGKYRLQGDGETVDWAVHMRRLSDARRADTLLERDRLSREDVEAIAHTMAAFHAEARCDAETTKYGSMEVIEGNVRENFRQTRRSVRRYLTEKQARELERWQLEFLRSNAAFFEARMAAERVRDGHGDLRLEHAYREDDAWQIIDCIEFNDRFRYADVCADIAFLSMDLAWHDRVDLAELFLSTYTRDANDYDLYPLLDFYQSYRAYVRGKVTSIQAESLDPDSDASRHAHAHARHYFLLALAEKRRSLTPPQVIAVGGPIASGKSTLATELAYVLGGPVLHSDRTRKFLAGVEATRSLGNEAWQGAYASEMTEKVYTEVMRRGDAVLRTGRPVVLDASFSKAAQRHAARELARRHHVPFHFVCCSAPRRELEARLAGRESMATVSDARRDLLDDFLRRFEPPEEIPPGERHDVDTQHPLSGNLEHLSERIGIERYATGRPPPGD